jgi:hypothetical protein
VAIYGPAGLNSHSDCGGVSTFRKARRCSQATPNQSSTLSLPNSATALTSLSKAGQTFRQATQVRPLRLCPNQGWPRHRPDTLANTRKNPAFGQPSTQWVAVALARFTVGAKRVSHRTESETRERVLAFRCRSRVSVIKNCNFAFEALCEQIPEQGSRCAWFFMERKVVFRSSSLPPSLRQKWFFVAASYSQISRHQFTARTRAHLH